ncbi:MAG: UDP-N-acetylmuramate--L-alanine ligase [Clostridia bacterium]|nr:UDP-N-acetylmuramate--L-alanine ligase [Clostridia bacterium]
MRLKALKDFKKVYFIGIGGVSMSALAKFLSVCGYEVSGSDAHKSELTEALAFYGARVYVGEDSKRTELIESDIVVYTDAISQENLELKQAQKLQKIIYKRGDFLQMVCSEFPHVAAIAGSHGKTTCTSMCTHILRATNVPFTAHIGGEDATFGNFYFSGMDYFLTEACEYKKNLLKIQAEAVVLLNIDKDHMECYQDEADLINCFRQYCKQADRAFVCADDEKCRGLGEFSTFGITNTLADYRAIDLRSNGERYAFTVEEYGKALCRIRLNAIGRCNVYNALAAFACMRSFGFHETEIKKGLETFTAVKRRFEKIGEYKGASFICDYAHHPKEIHSTLLTAEGICKGRLFVVFQPHTYSRTKLLMSDFIRVLRPIKNLMVYKTFAAREKYDAEGSAATLAHTIGNCLYAENVYVLKMWLKKTVRESDVVLFLGAGDIYYAAQYLLKELK